MRLRIALLLSVLSAVVSAAAAQANGDPASDTLPFSNVYFSITDPRTSSVGRDLLAVTAVAAKQKRPIRVAVIAQPSDLGLIQSLWQKPQPYAQFLGKELFQFARYTGTTLIVMPNGYGVYGPDAAKGRPALARLPKPGTGELGQLGEDAAIATRKVAAANGYTLPASSGDNSGTSGWLIVLAALGGAALIVAAAFFVLRRWLLQP